MKAFRRWLMSFLAGSDYAGPATLEVFGHEEHVGWVRAGEERIDILTVDGQAIQVDARARFRLTPMTWQELTDQSIQVRSLRERGTNADAHQIEWWRERSNEAERRINDLRKAIARARDEIKDFGDMDKTVDALNEALGADEQLWEGEFPF